MEQKMRRDSKGSSINNKKKKGKGGLPVGLIIVTVILTAALIALLALFFITQQRIAEQEAAELLVAEQLAAEAERLEREAIELQNARNAAYEELVNRTTFLPGITVDGMDIGGKTFSEAETLLNDYVAGKAPAGSLALQMTNPLNGEIYNYQEPDPVTGKSPFVFDLTGITCTSNVTDVLLQAFGAASGAATAEEALAIAEDIEANGKAYTLDLSYDFSGLSSEAQRIGAALDVYATAGSVGEIDKENHMVTASAPKDGYAVDREALTKAVQAAVEDQIDPNAVLEIPVVPVLADQNAAAPEMIYTSAKTSFKSSSKNRVYNLQKGAALMNGTVLKPGEVFSANGILGTRTLKNGWKMANAYVSGTTEEQAGGGVCQLSSTLYAAVLKADLEIVSRRNHSMPVSYMDKGLDATINSVGNIIDFKFKNNTDSDVVIFAWTESTTLYFKLYRCAFETDEFDEIKLTSKKMETIKPSGDWTITVDESLAPGEEQIIVKRQNGERWRSYKNYYKDGNLIRTETVDDSTYKEFNGEKLVGPDYGMEIPEDSKKSSSDSDKSSGSSSSSSSGSSSGSSSSSSSGSSSSGSIGGSLGDFGDAIG